jgi:hypothetical protein
MPSKNVLSKLPTKPRYKALYTTLAYEWQGLLVLMMCGDDCWTCLVLAGNEVVAWSSGNGNPTVDQAITKAVRKAKK